MRNPAYAEERVAALKKVIGDQGNAVLEDCETHLAYSGNNFYPFLWRHFKSHRSVLFKILQVVKLFSTSQDKLMEQAIEFLKVHHHSRAEWISTIRIEKCGKSKNDWKTIPLIDLSWVPDPWWRWISPNHKREPFPEEIHRRHFEACVFSQIMLELKSGDLYIEGCDKYADYREKLISWEEYDQGIEEFCEQVGLPIEKATFIEQVQSKLMNTANATDSSFPNNKYVRIEMERPFSLHSRNKQFQKV